MIAKNILPRALERLAVIEAQAPVKEAASLLSIDVAAEETNAPSKGTKIFDGELTQRLRDGVDLVVVLSTRKSERPRLQFGPK